MKFLFLTAALASAVCAKASEWHAHYRMTSDEYQSTFDHYLSQGYKVNSVSGYQRGSEDNYAAIFEKNDDDAGVAWVSHHRMTSDAYQQKFDQYVADGYRVRQVNGYNVGGDVYYTAIWDKTHSGPWVARHGMDSAAMQKNFDKYVHQEGYRLMHASAYEVNGESRFAAIWEKTDDGLSWWSWAAMTSTEYQKRFDDYLEEGYRLVDVNGYAVKDTVYYTAIWDNSTSGAWVARHGMDSPTFQKEFDQYKADGYVLDVLSGYDTGSDDRYAALWIKP